MSQHTSMEGLPPAIAAAITRYGNAMLDAGHASAPMGPVPDAETEAAIQTRRALTQLVKEAIDPPRGAPTLHLTCSPFPWWALDGGEILDAEGKIIVRIYGDPKHDAKAAGNASLFAAAPRLLVALAECRDWMVQFLEVCAAAGLCPPPNGAETARNAKLAIDEATRTGAWASEQGAERG